MSNVENQLSRIDSEAELERLVDEYCKRAPFVCSGCLDAFEAGYKIARERAHAALEEASVRIDELERTLEVERSLKLQKETSNE